MWAAVSAFLRTYGIILLLVAGGLAVAWRFVAPPPPDTIRIATGPEGSEYRRIADLYAQALEREGFRVERRGTQGAVENLDLLRRGEVDIGLAQGGIADRARDGDLVSLGSVFYEPAWVFVRPGEGGNLLRRPNQRIAMGPEGSGTRALARAFYEANGVAPDAATILPDGGSAAAQAVIENRADAAVFVAALPGEGISRLMRAEGIELTNFASRARAYAIRLPYLTPVVLPRSSFSLPEDLPNEDVTLMASAAYVAARADINPQVAALLVGIMKEVHKPRQAFAEEGRFPHGLNQDLPLQANAQRYYESGPPFLQAYLPFRWAVIVDQFWVLLIPLVPLGLLLIRFAPPLYTWQMESKIYRWYEDLRKIEAGLPEGRDRAGKRDAAERLDALEAKVAGIKVPTSYGRQLFALRRDIQHVRETMGRSGMAQAAASAVAKG